MRLVNQLRYLLLIVTIFLSPLAMAAPAFPTGYQLTPVAGQLNFPTKVAWLPDGTLLIAEKRGTIKAWRNGSADLVADLSASTNDYWDHGLLGMAVDADYANNHYLYLSRTFENNPSQYSGTKVSQLVRITLNTASTQMVAGSLVVLLGTQTPASCGDLAVTADCLFADSPSHSIGDVVVAADGTLYFSNGDGAAFAFTDPKAIRAQNIDSLSGKILHIDRNGKGVPGNAFYNGNPNDNRSKVYAYGLRNPWRTAFKPGTNMLYINDVGDDSFEEVNVGSNGGNYGWPCYEGSNKRDRPEIHDLCQPLYTAVSQGQQAVKYPLSGWAHGGNGAAIVGGVFVTGASYPADLRGAYLHGDYVLKFLRTLRTDANNQLIGGVTAFASGLVGTVNVVQGPDEKVYIVSIADDSGNPDTGSIFRLDYSSSPTACADGQFQADYFNGTTPAGTPVITRCEGAPLDHDWGLGSPGAGVSADHFAARWSGTFDFDGGSYLFDAWADDGIRVSVDGVTVIDGWKDQPTTHYAGTTDIAAGKHGVTVEYYDATEDAVAKVTWTRQGGTPGQCGAGQFKAEYFNNLTLAGTPALTRCEAAPLNQRWALASPGAGVNADNFSARWTGSFDFATGDYTFKTSADDGVRIFIDGTKIIDGWKDQPETAYQTTRSMTAGAHNVSIEYYDSGEDAVISASWAAAGSTNMPPVMTVTTPADNANIAIGATVNVAGSGSDPEDGAIAPDKLEWNVVIQHCAGTTCHNHFLQQFVGATGSFIYPDHGADQYFVELTLLASDSAGLRGSRTIRLNPDRGAVSCAADQFKAEYFNNKTLSGAPAVTNCTASVNFNWPTAAPAAGVNADNFSARYTTSRTFTAGTYRFTARADDGVRLYVDNVLQINGWKDQAATTYTKDVMLAAGSHSLRLEFYDETEDAVIQLSWARR